MRASVLARGGWALAVVAALFVPCARLPAQPSKPDPLANGAKVFTQQCAKCHGDLGEGRSGTITIAGPSLRAEHDYGSVMTAVETGPSHMPRFVYTLPIQDIRDVSRFVTDRIADIPLGASDIGRGGELFREYCAGCHRTAVRGGAMGFSGVNAPALTGKSEALIAGAIRWGPGPMPSFTKAALSEGEVASIAKYVHYAERPAHPGGATLGWYGPVPEGAVAWTIVFALICTAMWIERGGKG